MPELRVKASKICHFPMCPKRCKIEVLKLQRHMPPSGRAQVQGSKMHRRYSLPYKSWDRRLLRYQLKKKYGPVFERRLQVDQVELVVRGAYDDLRVLQDRRRNSRSKKAVSLIEVKTTSKKFMWRPEILAAVFQLQIYLWLMKNAIEALGYPVHSRHYLEVFSQKTGRLIRRLVVYEDPNIEKRLMYVVRAFQGLEKVQIPPRYVCKICPKNVKKECDWFNGYR